MIEILYILLYVLLIIIALVLILYFILENSNNSTTNTPKEFIIGGGPSSDNLPYFVYSDNGTFKNTVQADGTSLRNSPSDKINKIRISDLDDRYYGLGGNDGDIKLVRSDDGICWYGSWESNAELFDMTTSGPGETSYLFLLRDDVNNINLKAATQQFVDEGLNEFEPVETFLEENGEFKCFRGTSYGSLDKNSDSTMYVAVGEDTGGYTVLHSTSYRGDDDPYSPGYYGGISKFITTPKSVKYGNRWVLAGDNSGVSPTENIYYSDDGISWFTPTLTGISLTDKYEQVNYNNGKWVAVGSNANETDGKIIYSTNGISWFQSSTNDGTDFWSTSTTKAGYSVTYNSGNNKWYALGGDSTNNNERIYNSSDGITWELDTSFGTSPNIKFANRWITTFQ